MSRGRYPLLRADGQPWTPTVPAVDHLLRSIPRWVQNMGERLLRGEALTAGEKEKLVVWREEQKSDAEELWPDDHATLKRRWFEVQ